MYLSHWGLSCSPFHTAPGLGQPYPSQAFDEATARIDYLVHERRRMGALVGEPGLGKSTVLESLVATLRRRNMAVAHVEGVALTPQELLWQVASQFGASPDTADDTPRLWRRIEDGLTHLRWQNQAALLLVDDADQAGADVQRLLIRLASLESAPGARWTLLLAASSKRLHQLGEGLLNRIDLRVDLFPWTADDTAGFVQHALIDAGRLNPIFTDAALERIHERSAGVPRHIARLADFALVAGAGAGVETVDVGQIDLAFDQLRWSPPAEAHLVG